MCLGRIVDTMNKLVRFHPKDYRCVGNRWSITAYTNRACHKLTGEEFEVLRRFGFVIQKTSLPSSPAPKLVDPDEDLTLFEPHPI